MRLLILRSVACCLLLSPAIRPADGVVMKLSVSQQPGSGPDVLLFSDSATIVKGIPAIGFLNNLSVDLDIREIDSQRVDYTIHAITLALQPQTVARQFRGEYGIPARLTDLHGKNGAKYTLAITPVRRVSVDTSDCGIRHNGGESFTSQPTAHLDVYHVPRSFGEFYFPLVKGLMEDTYDRFHAIANFTLPGKYNLYLAPCPMYSVIWDSRFGTMVDPTRSSLVVIYNRQFNSADPFVIAHATLLRNLGYAPPALSEGLANYLSFAAYDAQRLHKEKQLPTLDSILNTYQYYRTDPHRADRAAASFVKYLADEYKVEKFLQLYRQADDLNLRDLISDIYGKPVAAIEKDWHHYLDTVTFRAGQAAFFADRAEAMFDYKGMLTYYREYLDLARTTNDSLMALDMLVRAHFLNGDYYNAEATQSKLLARDSSADNWLTLAGYQMMNGDFAKAETSLRRARAMDSANPVVHFNQAIHALYTDNRQKAHDLLFELVKSPGGGAAVEGRVLLGNLLLNATSPTERKAAAGYLSEAVAMAANRQRPGSPSAPDHMWTGIAYLGLGDTASAHAYLQTANFVETRPFYRGMTALWLGKCADVRGDRRAARDYYNQVLAQPSADYHQREARQYLETAYKQ